jgi:hypothetical protein
MKKTGVLIAAAAVVIVALITAVSHGASGAPTPGITFVSITTSDFDLNDLARKGWIVRAAAACPSTTMPKYVTGPTSCLVLQHS